MKNLILILNISLLFVLTGCLENEVKTTETSSLGSTAKPVYNWKANAWSACSVTACGSQGTQSRTVICQKNATSTVSDSFCSSIPKPATSQACSTQACINPAEINVRDTGAKGDGIADDTAAIQSAVKAVTAGGVVYVPAGRYMINALTNIKLKSNMHFKMHPDATLVAKPNSSERYYVISITSGISNVEVSGGRLLGERDQHIGTTGEWGYGIQIGGKAHKINIHDIHISKFWGDGICIGGYAYDIEIRRVVSTQNRRQGLSITRALDVRVYDSEFSYTNGTPPQYGIDIEPGPAYDARGIHIENCRIHNNAGGGILAYKKTYDIVIKGNQVYNNVYGLYTMESYNGQVTGNTFSHNRFQGVSLRSGTSNYTVSNNIFRNNSTKNNGYTNDTNPLTAITGLLQGTGPHINKTTDTINITVLTNQYAK